MKSAGAVTCGLAALVLVLSAVASSSIAADPRQGEQLARQWCVSCHVIGGMPTGSVQQGPPSFRAIAQRGLTSDQLRAFLSDPHPPMPNLALTRSEIDDLIAYIATLR
ncbi:MAG TPA: c-type cytochrome [Stellaceae bacterium]|nr:c-type cytochrome [Stellaceae bacterium]